MFTLKDIIAAFNKKHRKKIKATRTWGLLYLKPENLAFLNGSLTLVEDAAHYDPPFKINYTTLKAAVNRAKVQSTGNALKTLRQAMQQLKGDAFFLQRMDWEQKYKAHLNQVETWQHWEQELQQNNLSMQNKLQRLKLQELKLIWDSHQAFTHHSHRGLLYLLAKVVEYQLQFDYAIDELNQKQRGWFKSRRIPPEIAEPYQIFLQQQKELLHNLPHHIIETLLLRLRIAESQGNISQADVSRYVAQHLQQLPITCNKSHIPKLQGTISPFVFNQIHAAIEKHGNSLQKEQLYDRKWYKPGQGLAATGIKVVHIEGYRLLAPEELVAFVPIKPKKLKLFSDIACLDFFESHQQCFASFTSALARTRFTLNDLSLEHPVIQQLITHHRLIKAASLEKVNTIPWWQLKRKKLQQQWQRLLPHYIYQSQKHIIDFLHEIERLIRSRSDNIQNQAVYNQLWLVVHHISEFIRPSLSPGLHQQLERQVDKLAKLLKQDALSQWINILKESEVNPVSFTQQRKYFVIEVAEQMRLHDVGLPPHQQLSPVFFHLYADEKVKHLLSQLKSHFKQNHNIKQSILDMGLVNALDNEDTKSRLQKYLEKWLIRYAGHLADNNPAKALQFAKLACLMVRHYGSSQLQEQFNTLPACDNPLDWQVFIKGFNQITQALAAKYTEHYAEKACRKLEDVYDRELIKLTNHNENDYNLIQSVTKKLIAAEKLQLDEVALEPHEEVVKATVPNDKNSIQSLIELKASLPFFAKKIKVASSNEDKNKWLDLLAATTLQKCPDQVSLVNKRYKPI